MTESVPYPTAVVSLLLVNQFAERFTFYGIRSILSLYLTEELLLTERRSTMVYHFFSMLVFGFPIVGASIADSCSGKFHTIVLFSLVYIIGDVTLTLSTVGPLKLPSTTFALIGMVLIAIGVGSVKPCAAAFGGDQFVVPQQKQDRATFFNLFYFAINFGSGLAILTIPLLRKHIYCFDRDTCYALAFGVCTILMIFSLVVFLTGKPLYTITEPQGNMVFKMMKCVGTALSQKCKSKGVKKDHWLDFAADEHGQQTIDDLKIVLNILYMYIPLPLFWALYEQMASVWVFQARRMNGDVGELFTILPDQMLLCNSITILLLIPIINYCLYPLLNKCSILNTELQKITAGGVLTALAFVITGYLQITIENTFPVLPGPGIGEIRIFNILPCTIEVTCDKLNGGKTISISKFNFFVGYDISVEDQYTYNYTMAGGCSNTSGIFTIFDKQATSYFFNANNTPAEYFADNIEKTVSGNPNVRLMVNLNGKKEFEIKFLEYGKEYYSTKSSDKNLFELHSKTYDIQFGDSYKIQRRFQLGGVYTLGAIATDDGKFEVGTMVVTNPNDVHILWMIPQYLVISLGECLLSITGMQFTYSQAPKSMKSVMQGAWLLASSFGQLLVVILSAVQTFKKISTMMFLYAAIMAVDMILFAIMAISYVYV